MLHGSALAGVITLVDLFGAARIVNSRHFVPFESFIAAGVFYLGLTFINRVAVQAVGAALACPPARPAAEARYRPTRKRPPRLGETPGGVPQTFEMCGQSR